VAASDAKLYRRRCLFEMKGLRLACALATGNNRRHCGSSPRFLIFLQWVPLYFLRENAGLVAQIVCRFHLNESGSRQYDCSVLHRPRLLCGKRFVRAWPANLFPSIRIVIVDDDHVTRDLTADVADTLSKRSHHSPSR